MKISSLNRGEIHIELSDEGLVQFVLSDSLADFELIQVFSYWAPNSATSRFGRELSISPAEFEARASWLREVWANNGHTITFDPAVTLALKEVREGVASFQSMLSQRPSRHEGESLAVEEISRELTPEQVENVLCLLDMPNGANFSVPGAGKTFTTLALWSKLRERGVVDVALVVCPRSAFDSWDTELKESIDRHVASAVYSGGYVHPSTELLVVNYEQLENSEKLQLLKKWLELRSGHLIVDEAHRVKAGARSVRRRALRQLAAVSCRVDILTGTPMPNGPKDLKSLFHLTWPKLSNRFLTEDVLLTMSRKTSFVRTTKDELNLPDVTYRVVTESPSPLQAQISSALKDRYLGVFGLSILESQSLARKGKAVMTLLAAATNPSLLIAKDFNSIEFGFNWPPLEVTEDKALMGLIRDYLKHEIPWKFRFVAREADRLQAEGKKLLVWTSFVGNIAALSKVLTKFNPAVVHGAVDQQTREAELTRFRTDPKCSVLITNPQTLGEGISLHMDCHDAIYIDRTYNAGMYLQSVDRIHRLGLSADTITNITLLQTSGTIDERVASRLEIKIRNLSRFLQDKSLVESSIPSSEEIPAQEIFGLDNEDLEDIFQSWQA